jgi:hypothetical protein
MERGGTGDGQREEGIERDVARDTRTVIDLCCEWPGLSMPNNEGEVCHDGFIKVAAICVTVIVIANQDSTSCVSAFAQRAVLCVQVTSGHLCLLLKGISLAENASQKQVG